VASHCQKHAVVDLKCSFCGQRVALFEKLAGDLVSYRRSVVPQVESVLHVPRICIREIISRQLARSQASHGGLAKEWMPASTCDDGGVGDIINNIELIYDGGKTASTILCWQGGDFSTSTVEAFHLRCGCSKLSGHEVIRSPWLGSGPRRQINAGRRLPSNWPLFLGGDACRTPAKCGGGTEGLDCFRSFSSRVLCVKSKVLSSNSWFSRASDAMTFVQIVPATLQ
jgi:hypothetical protein